MRASTENRVTNTVIGQYVVWLACGLYVLAFLDYTFNLKSIRYIIYVVPLILIGSLFFERSPKSNAPAEAYLLVYIAMGVIAYFIGIQNLLYFTNEFLIMALVGLCFIPYLTVTRTQIRFIFFASAALLFLSYSLSGQGGIGFLEMFQTGGITPSETAFDDNSGGLIAPIYTVFFFAVRGKIEFVMAVIMTLLGGKRIALLAILVGVVSCYVFRTFEFLQKRETRFLVLLTALAAINIVAVHQSAIAEYLHSRLRPEAHIEEIMLGRHAFGVQIDHAMEDRSWLQSALGSGPGAATLVARFVSNGELKEVHNDWLKLVFDYGFVGSALITIFMALIFSSSRTAPAIAMTSAVIMMTDNVTIYLFYQIPVAFIVAYSRLHDPGRTKTWSALRARRERSTLQRRVEGSFG